MLSNLTGNRLLNKVQYLLLLAATIIVLAGLVIMVVLTSLNQINPDAASKLEAVVIGISYHKPPTSIHALVYPAIQVETSTPFQPLPTSTQTPTSSTTPLPSPTPTSTASPTSTETLPPTLTATLAPAETSLPLPSEPDMLSPITEAENQATDGSTLPESALIENIYGYHQLYNLDCESRAAVDWARYFGYEIDENEFLFGLPQSDDPNRGFVGDVMGPGGYTPPNSYGVHAGPISARLRAYGVNAAEMFNVSMDQLKFEIASGRPVVIWIIFGTVPGSSLIYTAQDGFEALVAPNEHAAILIGYDPNGVTILDGAATYWRSWDVFQQSFAALGNMAVFYSPPQE